VLPVCAIAYALALLMSAGAPEPAPVLLELDRGESAPVKLANGAWRTVKLLGYREYTEPYYESANKRIVQAVVSADVTVDVDGVTGKITGGPFRMPVAVNGISLLAGCTRGWTGGIEPDALTKDVRLEACDASRPWHSGGRLAFPVRNYRREGTSLPDRHTAAPDNAWLRSASISSMCSMPMQSRIVSGVTPAEANSASESCRCVVEAG
jgi:hypothetical protein